jgi:hypothetical protein
MPTRDARKGALWTAVAILGALALVCCFGWRAHQRRLIDQATAEYTRAVAAASTPPASFSRLQLPGMSIEAPDAAAVEGDYMTGSVQRTFPHEWSVTWQEGTLGRAEMQKAMEATVPTLSAKLGSPARLSRSRDVQVAGSNGSQFEFENQKGYRVVITSVECGGRVVQIVAAGLGHAADTSAKMVASFRCTPDPPKGRVDDAVAVDVRPGWRRTAPKGQPMLVNEREVLVRPTLLPGVDGATDELLIAGMRGAGFAPASSAPKKMKGRRVWQGSMDVGGETVPAAIVVWPCAGDRRTGMVYVFSLKGAPLDEGIELALTGRCLAPDRQAPDHPTRHP